MAGLVKDKATAFINELGGQVNNKILCKASSHDIAGPKKKHVDCKCRRTHNNYNTHTHTHTHTHTRVYIAFICRASLRTSSLTLRARIVEGISMISTLAAVLIQVTNDSQSSITELADLIFERSRHANWAVVMKLLITSHSLMTLGNEVSDSFALRSSAPSSIPSSSSPVLPNHTRRGSCNV